jgi:AcrR family transcriptional regulator
VSRPHLLKGERVPPPPQQRRSREKRNQLLSAALRRFQAKGYVATSMEDVAREAGTAVGTLYQHFRSKRQLLLVLMDAFLRRLEEIPLSLEGAPDVRAGIREILAAGFRTDLEYVGACRAWREAILIDPSLLRKQRQIEDWTAGRVRGAFLRIQALPGARAGVDAKALARVFDRLFWDLLGRPIEPMGRTVRLVADLIFHALLPDEDV